MSSQMGFAEAFLNDKAGRNQRLARIAELIDWAAFEAILPKAASPGPGRPAYRALSMFRALLLAQWYQLSDPALEEALADRISFRRFCGFALDDTTPDETTLCRFRLALAETGQGERLLAEFDHQLGQRGFLVKSGTMIDATLIEAQAARPPQVLPSQVLSSQAPPFQAPSGDERIDAQERQDHRMLPDPDARFVKKGALTVYGYKAHVAVDAGSGLIRRAILTPANVNDTTPADDLVMGDERAMRDERAIYADKAYEKGERRRALKARGIKDRIMHRASKHTPQLSHWKAKRNVLISVIRAAVERTFGTLKRSYGYTRVRYFSLAANSIELQLRCLAFNRRKLAALAH